jgi:hypothetical protein
MFGQSLGSHDPPGRACRVNDRELLQVTPDHARDPLAAIRQELEAQDG